MGHSQREGGAAGLTDGSLPGNWRLPTKEEWEPFLCLVDDAGIAVQNRKGRVGGVGLQDLINPLAVGCRIRRAVEIATYGCRQVAISSA
jgi:hypothetical protein